MKKGFTLIELLAVILILGIIALIAIPQITDVIEESKISSGKVSVDNYIDAVEDLAVSSEIKGSKLEGMYSSDELKDYGLEIKGDIKNVRVVIDATGNVSSGQFCVNDKSFTYDGQNVLYQEVLDLCNEVLLTKIKEVFVSNIYNANVIFAIDENNVLYGWGKNTNNSLLQESTREFKTPVKVGTNLKFKKVTTSPTGAVLGITTDGKLYSWGHDDGLLGFSDPTWESAPVREVLPGVAFKDVIIDEGFTAALDINGNVYAWGPNGYYAFNTSLSYTPTLIYANTNYESIYPAFYGVVALDNNGDIWTWGSSNLTANGTDAWSSYNAPTKRTNGLHIKKIDIEVNPSFALALSEDGKVYAWGSNYIRGITSLYNDVSPLNSVTLVKDDSNIIDIAASHSKSLLLYEDGKILETEPFDNVSKVIDTGKNITRVYTTGEYKYALDEYGNLYAWGTPNLLGLGDSLTYYEPIKISNQYKKANQYLFIDKDNKLRFYGYGTYVDNYENVYLPDSRLVDDVDVKDFDDSYLSYAIFYVDVDDNLKYMNIDNHFFNYYNNSSSYYNITPAEKGILASDVAEYKILDYYSGISLDANNDLRAWGFNYYGRFGNTKKETTWYATYGIATDHKVSKFASSEYNTYIIDTNGNLFGTGDNTYGQLGNGTTTKSSAFIPIMSGTKFKDVKADGQSFVAVTTDNKMYFCGNNYYILEQTSTPILIPFSGSLKALEIYDSRLIIRDNKDVLWGLGSNYSGSLGLGNLNKVEEFTKLFDGKKIKEIDAAFNNIYAIDNNNDLYVVGRYMDSADYNEIKRIPYKLLSNIESFIANTNFAIFKSTSGEYYGLGYNNYNILLTQPLEVTRPTKVNFYK